MRLLVAGLALLLLAGCTTTPAPRGSNGTSSTGTPPASSASLAFDRVDGCASSRSSEQQVVARSQADFDAMWRASCGPNPEPSVDFAGRTVLAYFWGEKRTGGFSTEVVNVTDSGAQVEVRVARDSPGPGCATAQIVTHPADVVSIPATSKPVTFTFVDRTVPC